jgi:hypothetical protein
MGIAPVSSMARQAPGPRPPALQAAVGPSTAPRPGGGVPVARRLGLFQAGTGGLLTRVVAPLLPPDLARGHAVHPALHPGAGLVADRGLCA